MSEHHGYACGCRQCSPERHIDYLAIGDRVIWTREEWERVAGPDAPNPFVVFRPIDMVSTANDPVGERLMHDFRWWEGEALDDEVSA